MQRRIARAFMLLAAVALLSMGTLAACSSNTQASGGKSSRIKIVDAGGSKQSSSSSATSSSSSSSSSSTSSAARSADPSALRTGLGIVEDYRASFVHGDKGAAYQKYIVLHDTESEASASSIVEYWDESAAGIASHFIVNRDGSIVQCVPLDKIAHHAGFGDTGHDALYAVTDESRDDKVGTVPIGSWASDYGMNSYSVGIEMVHRGDGDAYTQEQLAALDKLIAYINSYYGFTSTIIDHKMWRTGNSDTSPEFAQYLANYQDHNTHV
jgi:N-acetylmuramoyl-L-alanine amidase